MFVFNTENSMAMTPPLGHTQMPQTPQQQAPVDPWAHLPPKEWVEKQVEWGEGNISGTGLVDPINHICQGDALVGVEIGVCLGVTTQLFAQKITKLKKLYAVDNYPTFTDWNGVEISRERQDGMKEHAYNRLQPYLDKVDLVYQDSSVFAGTLEDNSLDFIFIDGDHSYAGVLRDIAAFYPKVKTGGVFAGHDLVLPTVQKALFDYFGNITVNQVSHDAWFIVKA